MNLNKNQEESGMKKLTLAVIGTVALLFSLSFAQESKSEMMGGNMMNNQQGMMGKCGHKMQGGMMQGGMMGSGMMGMMMQDPEIKKMMMEHMKKCRQEMMQKMMSNPKVVEKMMKMMMMHKETVKEVLKNNPQMKKQLKELTK